MNSADSLPMIIESGAFYDGSEWPLPEGQGMRHVIVDGTFLIEDEQLDTNAFPGKAVRSPQVKRE